MALISTRMGRWLAPFSQVLAILFLIVNMLLWMVPEWAEYAARSLSGLPSSTPLALTAGAKLTGGILSTLHLGILAYALFAIAGIFRIFAAGEWLRPEISGRLHRFGLALLLFGAGTPLVRALMTVIVTLQNPEGQRALAISFSGNDFVIALVGVLMVMLGYALREAAAIAEDNRQIV
ncbi:MAG: DUF2975 domain-containing protein [Thiolinea sp.]